MSASIQYVRPRISPALGTFVLLLGLNLPNYIDRYILPGEVSLIQREFHSTDQQMGALTTALFVFYMLAAPATGWLGTAWRKPLIICGAVLWSLATLATAWVHDYRTLYIRHALVGVGEATFGIFAPAVLADFYRTRSKSDFIDLLFGDSGGCGAGLCCRRALGTMWGWRQPFFICAIPGLVIAAVYGWIGAEPQRGGSDRVRSTAVRSTFLGLFRNPAFLCATFGLAAYIRHGWHLQLGAGVSAPFSWYLRSNAATAVGAITVIDGIAGTVVGGWIAQLWLRTNHRALYLLSFWSVAITLPCGALLFFGPPRWTIPMLLITEFFLFLNTGPLNAAIVNSVSGPVRATAISLNLFCIHCFGDTFAPQIIGAISDRSNLRIALGATLIFLVLSGIILRIGAHFAPPLEESTILDR